MPPGPQDAHGPWGFTFGNIQDQFSSVLYWKSKGKKKEEKWKRLPWFRESWHRMWRHAGSILAASLFPTLIISSCSAACSSSWYVAFSVRCFFLTPTSLLTYSCSRHWPLPHSDTLLPYNTAQGSPATEKEDKSSFPTNSHWHLFSPVLFPELDWIAKAFMIIGLKKRWTQTACKDITKNRPQRTMRGKGSYLS